MTSSGHVTSLGACPNDSPRTLSYRLSIGSLEPSRYSFVSETFSPKVPKLRQRLLRDDVINNVIRSVSTIREDHIDTPYRGNFVKISSSNSDKNCRRRCILKKNPDVTNMTSSSHVQWRRQKNFTAGAQPGHYNF